MSMSFRWMPSGRTAAGAVELGALDAHDAALGRRRVPGVAQHLEVARRHAQRARQIERAGRAATARSRRQASSRRSRSATRRAAPSAWRTRPRARRRARTAAALSRSSSVPVRSTRPPSRISCALPWNCSASGSKRTFIVDALAEAELLATPRSSTTCAVPLRALALAVELGADPQLALEPRQREAVRPARAAAARAARARRGRGSWLAERQRRARRRAAPTCSSGVWKQQALDRRARAPRARP